MGIEHPEILLKRLKLGREEYCQRLLTMLLLNGAYPRWNTPSTLSPEGAAFLTALDRLSFDAAGELDEAAELDEAVDAADEAHEADALADAGRLDEASFVDEFDLPARTKEARGCAPDYAVVTPSRLWLLELKTERRSHRSDQLATYFDLATHHHPGRQVDVTYLTGPGVRVDLQPPEGSRFAHLTWDDVMPLLDSTWAEPTEEQRLLVEQLHAVLDGLDVPWRQWRADRLAIEPEPEWEERDPEQEALELARAVAADRGQRALDFEATDLEQLKELRADVAELISRDGSSALRHVRPWLWDSAISGGAPLTEAGASVGFELRLSWFKSSKRPTPGSA